MSDLKSQLIKMGASLLRYRPSTLRQDFPRVPAYYRKSADDYHERGRQAAILMREAHDKITALEAEITELHNDVGFYRCCALSGEIPDDSVSPSALLSKEKSK